MPTPAPPNSVAKALAVAPYRSGEIALPADLIEAARDYLRASHAPRTVDAYERAWAAFEAWCLAKGLPSLPASPETVALWMAALAKGEDGRRPLSCSSINQALAAVILAHRDADHPFDRKHRAVARMWRGISNTKAKTATVQKALPLMADDLRAFLDGLDAEDEADVRDATLLSLGWAAALRRSELVGLDWQERGDGGGYVRLDGESATIVLMSSKASQDQAETIVVPRADMPSACQALEMWAALAKLAPGEPVFRAVDQTGSVGTDRLTDRSVSRIVKRSIARLARGRGRTKAEARNSASGYSGHSMRAGFATSAAAKNVPSYRIRVQTRHKSVQVLEGYIREAEKLSNNALKGVGF